MDPYTTLNAVDAAVVIGAAVPSIAMATKITLPKIKNVAILLASFLLIHGVYHLLSVVNAFVGSDVLDFLSDGFVEPLSYLILLLFAIFFYWMGE